MQRPSIAGHRAPSSAPGCTHAPKAPTQAPSGVLPRRGQAIKARGVAPAPADAAGRPRSIRSARACHAKCKRPREGQPSGQARFLSGHPDFLCQAAHPRTLSVPTASGLDRVIRRPRTRKRAARNTPARRKMRPLLLVTALLELSGASLLPGPALRPEAPPRRRQRSVSLRMGAFALKPTVTLDADVGAAYGKTKIGVLLLNLGGPDDLDAVEPFLWAGTHRTPPLMTPRSTLTRPPHTALEAPPLRAAPPAALSAERSHPPVAVGARVGTTSSPTRRSSRCRPPSAGSTARSRR